MDANQTRYQLLLGHDDWSACQDGDLGTVLAQEWASAPPHRSQLDWDPERQELTLKPRLFMFRPPPKDNPPRPEDRRGAGRDRYGNWYWIDASRGQVLVTSAGSGGTTVFWPVAQAPAVPDRTGSFQRLDPAPARPDPIYSGLAVTADHYLVVGIITPSQSGGLLVFDLHAGGGPQTLAWPAGVSFVPFDISPRPGGGVWILDRLNKRLWGLDRRLNPTGPAPAPAGPDAFQPLGGGTPHSSAPLPYPPGFSLPVSSPVEASDPIAVETLPDDSALILDRVPDGCFSSVGLYRRGQLVGQPVSFAVSAGLVETPDGDPFCLHGHDLAFVGEHVTADGEAQLDRIYVAAADGNQAIAFNISLGPASPLAEDDQLILVPLKDYFPMRLYAGGGLVAAGDQAYYDFSNGKNAPVRWVPLVAQPRPRYSELGTLDTMLQAGDAAGGRPAFDGRIPDCTWHRLDLDGCIPPGTAVQIWSRAANTQAELAQSQWRPEPQPYLRRDGSELPYLARVKPKPGEGTWELLLQQARGRYLQVRLQLSGNGRSSPRLRALRAYYPRFSYLEHYLPATYRQDPLSADFLDRFLANFEGFYTAIEDRIAAVQVLFDLRTVPPEALEWLASFYGIVFDPAWNTAQQYLLVKYAMQFFQYRGTIPGLQMVLYLALNAIPDEAVVASVFNSGDPEKALDLCGVRIVERFRTRQAPAVVFGDPSSVGTTLGGGQAKVAFRPPANWQLAPGEVGYLPSLNLSGLDPDVVQSAWQDFLLRRYRQVNVLNRAHGSYWNTFSRVPMPGYLPFVGSLTRDWYLFENVVLAMHRTAHRFTVMLPASRDLEADSPEHQRRLDLVRRIVELEKPAHTIFDVRFYWAMFRIGEARLGLDTLVDLGGRNPALMPGMILGQGHLSEGALAPGHPQDVKNRSVLGRDRLSPPAPLRVTKASAGNSGASQDPHQT